MQRFVIGAATLAMACSASAQQVDVILSEVGPTSDVGVSGRFISSMADFSLSPNGLWWSLTLALNGSGADNDMHIRGSGTSWTDHIYQEGVTALPSFPGVTGFATVNSSTYQSSINDSGFVVGLVGNTISAEPGEFVYRYNGSSMEIVAGETGSIPAFPGEFYGNTMHSPNITAAGKASFVADNITGTVPTSMDLVTLTVDGDISAGHQKGVTTYPNGALETIDQAGFYVTPDGGTFLYRGDTDGLTDNDDVIVYGTVGTAGTPVLMEGITSIAGGFYDDTFHASLASNGDWYVSGDLTDGTYITVKNGSVLAMEGDLAPNGFLYGDIPNIVGDSNGNYLWTWDTDNPDTTRDEILVYNGTELILSEGDMIMFDQGSGLAPAIIDEFNAFDIALSDDGWAYLMVQLDDLNGNNIGDAFIRVQVPAPGSICLLACGLFGLRRRRRQQ